MGGRGGGGGCDTVLCWTVRGLHRYVAVADMDREDVVVVDDMFRTEKTVWAAVMSIGLVVMLLLCAYMCGSQQRIESKLNHVIEQMEE